eukprot:COSAG02_NODE_5211_length_4538_cov_2.567695_2_plen_108_part_00
MACSALQLTVAIVATPSGLDWQLGAGGGDGWREGWWHFPAAQRWKHGHNFVCGQWAADTRLARAKTDDDERVVLGGIAAALPRPPASAPAPATIAKLCEQKLPRGFQ